jgi:hypothetical protein
MARMNRETDRSPRFTGGMTKPMSIKKKVQEKPEYDYSERKEGFGRIAKQHKIMKDMGYDLDAEIEMPELAPTKRELGKLRKTNASKVKNIEADRFNRLRGALGKEEKAMTKFHKRHLKGKSFESANEEFSAYAMYGGEHPYQNFEMKKNVIDKYFDEDYETFIMFKSPEYKEISKHIDNLERWKTIYQSSSGQGEAKINPDGNIIKASILDGGGIVGAIYIKKSKLERLLKERAFESLNESSYDDFFDNYAAEIVTASKQLREMSKVLEPILKNEDDPKADEFFEQFDDIMQRYDKNVAGSIEHWIMIPSQATSDDIAKFALRNQDRFGTEPKMLLYAIEDAYNLTKEITETEDE